jgi:hypothetical protein
VTFVIAKITDMQSGTVSVLADTKLTYAHDQTLTRRTLSNPCQKLIILDDDIVVGFAGDTPESAQKRIVGLRGESAASVTEALISFTAEIRQLESVSKKFLVVERLPEPRISLIDNGIHEDRTTVGTGWIGDPDAFRAFSRVYQDHTLQRMPKLAGRFFLSMVQLVLFDDVETVGGYVVRVTGSRDRPFRFGADPGRVLPDDLHASVAPTGGLVGLSVREGSDPTTYARLPIPGVSPTCGALAHYIPEAGVAWLHTHEEPWRTPERLTVDSVGDLCNRALSDHGQHLDNAIAQYVAEKYGGTVSI